MKILNANEPCVLAWMEGVKVGSEVLFISRFNEKKILKVVGETKTCWKVENQDVLFHKVDGNAREQGASWRKAKIRFLSEDMKKDLEKQKVESDLFARWNLEKELLNFNNLALDQKKELVELLEKFSTARKMKNV